jgi:peptide/nickel transport system permease protein
LTYLIKRLLLFVPTLIGVVSLVFLILHATPGSPATRVLGEHATAESIAAFERRWGLHRPLIEQYVHFVVSYAQGDFGKSYRTGEPVLEQILRELPYTFHLAVAGMLIAVVLGVTAGILAAVKPNSLFDNLGRVFALLGVSMPVFWSGMILIIIFSLNLRWFPIIGAGDIGSPLNILYHLVLPATTIGLFSMGVIMRMTRSSMLEVLDQDYIRTAFSKGISNSRVYIKHALRNASIPILTIIGLSFGGLLGGAVLTETVFARHGIGSFLIDSITWKDYPAAQGCIFTISLMFLIINLITDLLYGLLDPRIRRE